jgi:GABA(A) receptor-associated protein
MSVFINSRNSVNVNSSNSSDSNGSISNKLKAYHLLQKYPDKIPVIVTRVDKNVPELKPSKFIVPDQLTVGQFLYTLRTRILLRPEQALFIFFNNEMACSTDTMRVVYNKHRNKEDNMLYAMYGTESTFG